MKRLNYRELMQNNVDNVFSRFTGAIVKRVLKQFGVISVTGTIQPVPIALATKINSVEAYFNTNFSKLTTMQVNEFKAWIKTKPNFLKS
jgi:poly-gamma-glutamate capsule biosynthesis protein CapA/YwtB (metallophosphatase superfamily)